MNLSSIETFLMQVQVSMVRKKHLILITFHDDSLVDMAYVT